jgi:hypothetical protein
MSFFWSTPTRYQTGFQQQQQQQQQVPANTQATQQQQNILKASTPFLQLEPRLRSQLEAVQKYMNEGKALSEEIAQHSTDGITEVALQADNLAEKLTSLIQTIENDKQVANALKKDVAKELKNIELAMRAIERLKTPMGAFNQNFHAPSKYWWDMLDSFEQRMNQYKQTMETIEKYLTSANQHRAYSPQMLQEVMKNQMEFFLELSARLAILSDQMQELQQEYLRWRKTTFNDTKNPFETKPTEASKKTKRPLFSTTSLGILATPQTQQQQQQQQQQQGFSFTASQTQLSSTKPSFTFETTPSTSSFTFGSQTNPSSFSFGHPTSNVGGGSGSSGSGSNTAFIIPISIKNSTKTSSDSGKK